MSDGNKMVSLSNETRRIVITMFLNDNSVVPSPINNSTAQELRNVQENKTCTKTLLHVSYHKAHMIMCFN